MSGERYDCSRTRGIVERLVAGSIRDDDRVHAADCPACGPVFARAAWFGDELERTTRELAAEDLPHGVLDPSLADLRVVPRMPGLAPGATAGFAALAFVLLVTVVGVRPVLLPGASPTEPPFAVEMPGDSGSTDEPLWTLNELTLALADSLAYECAPVAPPNEGAEATAVCTAPPDAGPFTAAVTLDASESGTVVRVTISAEIDDGTPNDKQQAARRAVAGALAKVTAAAFIGRGAGVRAANFVFVKASQLSGPAWVMGIDEGGVRVDLQRLADGGYIVHLSVA
jgi:hypothetical protein